MESVTTMILKMFFLVQTWLMLHLIMKSSASVVVTKATWCNILIIGQLAMCTYEMNVAISFLILASITMMAEEGEENNSRTILSSCWKHILSFLFLVAKLKEKRSEKLSIILEPRKSSRWRGEKEGNIPYNLLFESTKCPLMLDLWWLVRDLSDTECWHLGELKSESISVWIRWLGESVSVCNYNLPTSFWRWSLIGMRPTIASISSEEDILKASSIQMVALLCILLRIFSGYERGVQL